MSYPEQTQFRKQILLNSSRLGCNHLQERTDSPVQRSASFFFLLRKENTHSVLTNIHSVCSEDNLILSRLEEVPQALRESIFFTSIAISDRNYFAKDSKASARSQVLQ